MDLCEAHGITAVDVILTFCLTSVYLFEPETEDTSWNLSKCKVPHTGGGKVE